MRSTIFYDDFGNVARIEELQIFPYHGAEKRERAYRLTLADTDNGYFIYHVSVHETLRKAEETLHGFSAGTFRPRADGIQSAEVIC